MATAASKIAFQAEKGSPHPLGATADAEGVNFSLFSKNGTTVDLLLFKRAFDGELLAERIALRLWNLWD